MRILQWAVCSIRVASSAVALFAPIVEVTYPNGQTDKVGAAIMMLYVLPASMPYVPSKPLAFIGITMLLTGVVAVPLAPFIVRVKESVYLFEMHKRRAIILLATLIAMCCIMVVGYAALSHPFATVMSFEILYGLSLTSLAADALLCVARTRME